MEGDNCTLVRRHTGVPPLRIVESDGDQRLCLVPGGQNEH